MRPYLYSCLLIVGICSCATVKPYERQYVADPEMQMGGDAGTNFSDYVHAIREGAAPVGTSKGNGGCGCN